jgi:hypothetical protein
MSAALAIYDTNWHRRALLAELAEMLQAAAAIAANSAFLGDDKGILSAFQKARLVLLEALPEARVLAGEDVQK